MNTTRLRAFLRDHWGHCAAAALIGLTLIQNAAWISQNTAVETWDDDAGLYGLATCLEDQFRGQGTACFSGAPYPPLIPAVAAVHFLATGLRGVDMALQSLWPWMVLLGVALWVGIRKAAGPWAGLAAVALGPVVVWSLHIRGKFYTEVPLAALAVASVVAWVACEGFRRRRAAVGLGVFLGLGLLTKWSFAFFLGPPMALAWAVGLAGPVRSRHLQWTAGAAVLTGAGLIAAGASGRLMGGLWPGLCVLFTAVICLLVTRKRSPQRFDQDTSERWTNLGLASLALLVVAGPWYLTHLGDLQAFLADNMAQKFHGDVIGPLDGIPFYPAVLLTRVLGAPLALLLILGTIRALLPGRTSLAAWSLLALVSGMLILGLLPYRSGRYLVAGLGLAVPVLIICLARLPRVGTIGAALALAAGLVHQLSWIPLQAGTLHVPHHWPIFTLPEQDLFGNTKDGIAQASRDLIHPRWRFLPVASPPVDIIPAARRLVQATARDTRGPFLLVVMDPAGRLNANSLQTEVTATRAAILSAAIPGDVQPTDKSLTHWRNLARHPPDSPATAHADVSRWLYIATAVSPDDLDHGIRVERLVTHLESRGWSRLLEQTIDNPFKPTAIQLWRESQ